MAYPRVADGGDGLQIRKVAANVLTEQLQTATKQGPSSLRVALTFITVKTSVPRNVSQRM
jgi:hypothetical protein